MKIEIKKTKEDGIIQITTLDERWYEKDGEFNPSVTWVAGSYPKGIYFYKWLAEKGWDEAEALKVAAGERGSKVHQACEELLLGNAVKMDSMFLNTTTKMEEELSVQEYEAIMTFKDFWEDMNSNHKVELVGTEQVLWVPAKEGEKYGYAGTRDIKVMVDGEPWIWDIKTSKQIWTEYELQLSAYKHADPELPKIGIVQVGYNLNKRGWKFSELEDKYDLFLHAKAIWEHENPDTKPKQKDYPAEIKLTQVNVKP